MTETDRDETDLLQRPRNIGQKTCSTAQGFNRIMKKLFALPALSVRRKKALQRAARAGQSRSEVRSEVRPAVTKTTCAQWRAGFFNLVVGMGEASGRRGQSYVLRWNMKYYFRFVMNVTNEEVRSKIQQTTGPHEDLLTTVKRRKLQWYGHVSSSSGLAKDHLARHSERGKKTRQTEEEVGRQHQGLDKPGVRQVPEGSGEQGKWRKLVAKSSVAVSYTHLTLPTRRTV